jgi:hypothetical protein
LRQSRPVSFPYASDLAGIRDAAALAKLLEDD